MGSFFARPCASAHFRLSNNSLRVILVSIYDCVPASRLFSPNTHTVHRFTLWHDKFYHRGSLEHPPVQVVGVAMSQYQADVPTPLTMPHLIFLNSFHHGPRTFMRPRSNPQGTRPSCPSQRHIGFTARLITHTGPPSYSSIVHHPMLVC